MKGRLYLVMESSIFTWLTQNKQWFFSGAGIALISFIISLIIWLISYLIRLKTKTNTANNRKTITEDNDNENIGEKKKYTVKANNVYSSVQAEKIEYLEQNF